MKELCWLSDVLVCLSCEKKSCLHWVPVNLVRDLEALDGDDGVCGAQFVQMKDGRCTTFKYRNEHILPREQKVLK